VTYRFLLKDRYRIRKYQLLFTVITRDWLADTHSLAGNKRSQ